MAGVEAVSYARWGEKQIGTAIIENMAVDVVAEAIYAERKRAAKIAEGWDTPFDSNGVFHLPSNPSR